MAQTIILAPGSSAATSTDIVVPAGDVVTVGIYTAIAAVAPTGARFSVMQGTPGADNVLASLNNYSRTTALVGPGTYRVQRPAYAGTGFGVFTEA